MSSLLIANIYCSLYTPESILNALPTSLYFSQETCKVDKEMEIQSGK